MIVATHRNLAEEVKKGQFREDLYYRIIGLPIELPPLRERGNDVLILPNFLLMNLLKKKQTGALQFTSEAKDKLLHYHFPGNVRELKSIVELAAVMCENNEIGADDITYTSTKKDDFMMARNKTL